MNWLIRPSDKLRGDVHVPGDKSISHRAVMHAALAQGTSHIRGFLRAGVTEAMLRCVRDLGLTVEFDRQGTLVVDSAGLYSPAAPLDCGNSGATIRMLMGALAGWPDVVTTLSGSAGLRRRPMKRVTEPLRLMGADIAEDTPPLVVRGQRLHGIEYTLPVASAQVKAAILLAALQANGPTTIHEPGPSRDHSERMLRALGVSVVDHDHTVTIEPIHGPLPAFDLNVPGDISSATFLFAAAALALDSEVTIREVGMNETRTGIIDALQAMRAAVTIDNCRDRGQEPVADVNIRASELHGITISGDWVVRMIDEFPMLAVMATQAKGQTIVCDAAELRVKESDRIGTLATELRKFGAQIEERPDGFSIEGPTRLHGAVVDSHGDHRLAMSLAVAGLIADGETTVVNAEAYRESFPNFVELMNRLGASIG